MNKIISATLIAFSLFSNSAWADMVNINKASAAQIKANLKGIGEKKAEAIVAYRTEHGEFKTIEGIKDVKGIGDGIFEKIKVDLSLDQGIDDTVSTLDAVKAPGKKAAAAIDKDAEEAAKDVKAEPEIDKVDKKTAADTLSTGKKDKS